MAGPHDRVAGRLPARKASDLRADKKGEEETMPRQEIDLPYRVEFLSVLNENGELDKDLEPEIPDEELLKLHRAMLFARRFDERMLTLQRQGRIGTFGPSSGQEASHIGAVSVLEPEDWMVPAFREMGAELLRGKNPESVLLTYGGYNEGGRSPAQVNNLPLSIPVASQTLHAVGLAYAMKYRKKNQVAMTFFGDGATSEGDFHEAMNFAAVLQAPVIFVCQNNHWAISIPRAKQTRSKTLAQKALAYGMPGIQVDGNDILAVHTAAKEAVDRARSGEGPSMIECVTYRMTVHTTADDPKRYRTDEEVAQWAKRDPITRFQKYLTDKGLLSKEKIDALEEEIKAEIGEVVEGFEAHIKGMGDPMEMFDHAYAELPPYLEEQKEELKRNLSEQDK
jgi:pyruvate dehydrogenase E1 component alpha subunit